MKLYVTAGEEAYPVRSVSKKQTAGHDFSIEVTEEEATYLLEAEEQYWKAQRIIEEKLGHCWK
jgi:hypothetical protein